MNFEGKVTTNEVIHFLKSNGDLFLLTMEETMDMNADFTPDSLLNMQSGIYKTLSEPTREQPPMMLVLALAHYFGETLIRNFPDAYWMGDDTLSDPLRIRLVIPYKNGKKADLYPGLSILNFFHDKSRTLYSVYETANYFATHNTDLKSLKENWTHIDNHNAFRIRHAFTIPAE